MTDSRPGTRHPSTTGRRDAAPVRPVPGTGHSNPSNRSGPSGRARDRRRMGADQWGPGTPPAPPGASARAPRPTTANSRRQRRRRRERQRRWLDLTVLVCFAVLLSLVIVHLPEDPPSGLADRSPATRATGAASRLPPSGTERADLDGENARDGGVTRTGIEAAAMAVPAAGSGRVRLLPVPGRDSRATGRTIRYAVAIEGGLRVRIDDLPATVRSILVAPRGWESVEDVHFVALNPRQALAGVRPDVQIILASPALVDRLCHPLQTHGEVSCFNDGRVVLNARRWWAGATTYGANLAAYRTYLVNHEVGHALGRDHATCARPGGPAPVMLQQTIGLGGCHPYPYPR